MKAALSTLFKVDGALRRVGGENDYIYYAGKRGIHKILKRRVGGENDYIYYAGKRGIHKFCKSRWRIGHE